MSSEEKISPDEFDQELEALMSGKKEPKKKKGGKKKKIAVSAAVILVLGIAAGKILGGGKDMVPVVDTVNPVRKRSRTASPSPARYPGPTAWTSFPTSMRRSWRFR